MKIAYGSSGLVGLDDSDGIDDVQHDTCSGRWIGGWRETQVSRDALQVGSTSVYRAGIKARECIIAVPDVWSSWLSNVRE